MEQPVKRRRVTRACDECRKKKVKCDGKQPCIHCTVYNYECTYNQPTRRSAGGGSGSGANGNGHNTSSSLQGTTTAGTGNSEYASGQNSGVGGAHSQHKKHSMTKTKQIHIRLSKYEELFKELFPDLGDIDSIDIPTFSRLFGNMTKDLNMAEMVREYRLIAPTEVTPIVTRDTPDTTPQGSTSNGAHHYGGAIESVDGSIQSHEGKEIKIILPPKPIAIQFIKSTWENCCVLFRFYHRPSFIRQLDLLYETDPQNYTHEQMQFLPLCYAVMAVGALFTKTLNKMNDSDQHTADNDVSTKFLQDEGYKYFIAARKLIDITNARDLNSIQTIVLMFLFLQCSARLSTCYSYIGVAMRSALREGLHRKLEPGASKMNYIEIEMRKRLFYTIYKMDIYINTMLGLPRTISPRDFDQEFPLELNDDYITEDHVYAEQQGDVLSSSGIANQHTKLLMILDQIMADLYPIKKTNNLISHEMVTRLELKLRQWLDGLPPELIPGLQDVPERYLRANRLLHLSFLQVQIVLYRPFIHYLSPSSPQSDSLSVQRAKNCISVARTVVKLAKEMMDEKILAGSYWFSIYTIFFSVAALIYYVTEFPPTNPDDALTYDAIVNDVTTGKQVLLQLKGTSVAASRTHNLLSALFNSFNAKIKQSMVTKNTDSSAQQNELKIEGSDTLDSDIFDIPAGAVKQEKVDGLGSGQISTPRNQQSFLGSTFSVEPTTSISGVNTLNTSQTANLFSSTNLNTESENSKGLADYFGVEGQQQQNQDLAQQTPQLISGTTPVQIPDSSLDGTYVPGMFDQLDVQLFGRYLPPYMSGLSSTDKDHGNNES